MDRRQRAVRVPGPRLSRRPPWPYCAENAHAKPSQAGFAVMNEMVDEMAAPLYQAKADLFRTLGHPVRIRVLELLQDGPRPVRELLDSIQVESSNLSQQLAVLRRAGLVTSSRDGASVLYTLSTPDVAELMRAARRILTSMLSDQEELLTELRTTAEAE